MATPNAGRPILDHNRHQMDSDLDLRVGMELQIPPPDGVEVEESRFVVELAYRRHRSALGLFGREALSLPTVDVDVVRATWHLYLPQSIDPLAFDANLVQYSAIRYDPFRRLRTFLTRALIARDASAGGGSYRSILEQRKGIYMADSLKRGGGEAALGNFPLVGQRFRFKRLLMGTEAPRLRVTYIAVWALTAIRLMALIIAAWLTAWVLSGGPHPRRWRWVVAAFVGAGLLTAGHYVLGVNRHIVWGADLALGIIVLRTHGRSFLKAASSFLQTPWEAGRLLTFRNLLALVGTFVLLSAAASFPLLCPLLALVGLGSSG